MITRILHLLALIPPGSPHTVSSCEAPEGEFSPEQGGHRGRNSPTAETNPPSKLSLNHTVAKTEKGPSSAATATWLLPRSRLVEFSEEELRDFSNKLYDFCFITCFVILPSFQYSLLTTLFLGVLIGAVLKAATVLEWSKIIFTRSYGRFTKMFEMKFTKSGEFPPENLYRSRLIKITDNTALVAGDVIVVRFRLFSDAAINSWGWAIDNLSIQGPITGLPESVLADQLLVYPNPVRDDGVSIDFSLPDLTSVQIQIVNAQGQAVLSEDARGLNGNFKRTYATAGWADGMYLVRLQTDRGQVVRKVVKIR